MIAPGRGAVVITGASRGIGEACALRLDLHGFRVFAGVRTDADGAALKRKASDRLTPVLLDVTKDETITSSAQAATAAVGDAGVAGLVNNAGIVIASPLEFLPIAELRRQLEVNVIGQIAVTQAFLPLLRKASGRIVNIGSISGRVAFPLVGAYAASKFAMEALTDALRVELLSWGIFVSIVDPGNVATSIWETSIATAVAIMKTFPPQAHDLYGRAMTAVRDGAARRARTGAGLPPDEVAKVVEHALTAARPRTRYLVGRDAKLGSLFRHLPDRMRDRMILGRRGRR